MNNFGGFYYPVINMVNDAISPSTVHVKNTGLARFFKRYLLQEAMSVFDWKLPETWDRSYFLYVLYIWGYISIVDTDLFGVIPQHCTLGGYNVFYAPKYAVITNPLFRETYRPVIGEDCELLRLEPDYLGLYDIVDYYGDLMALAAEACGVNLLNSKLSFLFAADGKVNAETLKKAFDNYASGDPAVFVDKSLFTDDGKLAMQMFNQDVGGNFIADRLLDVMNSTRCRFLTDIGIPNTNLYKASGVGNAEVNANNVETRMKCASWLEDLKQGCEKVRNMFGIGISVEWREELKNVMGGEENERMGGNSGDL